MLRKIEKITVNVCLEEVLKQKRVTVYRLAKDTGIGMPTLYNMKNHFTNIPEFKILVIICDYLEIQITELIQIVPNDTDIEKK